MLALRWSSLEALSAGLGYAGLAWLPLQACSAGLGRVCSSMSTPAHGGKVLQLVAAKDHVCTASAQHFMPYRMSA